MTVFFIEIITPEGIFFRGSGSLLELDTTAGKIGIYRNHIPLTVVLAPGILKIHDAACKQAAAGKESAGNGNVENGNVEDGNVEDGNVGTGNGGNGSNGNGSTGSGSAERLLVQISSGFAEILPDRVTVLTAAAERIITRY